MIHRLLAIAWLVACLVAQLQAQTNAAFPKGDIKGPFPWKSNIYPGTERDYWVYVPKQYDGSKPACSMIVQDGLPRATGWRLPTVLDSLIALKQIPVIIGIFVNPGTVPAAGTDNYPRFNRSFEYDALGDRYARFLIEEILPEIGKSYNLSKDPSDRSIAGASSGAICAFNVAWERPYEFRRVLSTIGTYVGLRGGDEFPTLVRKTEPKPLRVFLEDGSGDLNIYGGDWWTANQAMLSALTWAGYEVNHAWGTEGHNSKGAAKILPEALKWLWKDHPQPVKTHTSPAQRFNPILEDEPWKEIRLTSAVGGDGVGQLAVNEAGDLCFSSADGVYKLGEDGKASLFVKWPYKPSLNLPSFGIAYGNNGALYASDVLKNRILQFDANGQFLRVIVPDARADQLVASQKGIYFSGLSGKEGIGFYNFATKSVSQLLVGKPIHGIALTSDQTFLNAATTPFGYSLKVREDGSLGSAQEYVHFHIPYQPDALRIVGGMAVDSENRLYTPTKAGVQVSDQLGRVNFIISNPPADELNRSAPLDAKFGGKDLQTLYLSFGGRLFSRKLSTKGVLPFLPPVKPPKPGL